MQLNHETKTADCTPAELAEGVQALHQCTINGLVKAKNTSFVNSLITSHQKYNKLSPKQSYWVFMKMYEALGVAVPGLESNKTEGKRKLANIDNVFDMFAEAKKTLKKPGVLFPNAVPGGIESLDLKVYPGYDMTSLNVIVPQQYPSKVAWISNDGTLNFKYNSKATSEQKAVITELLKEFATDPQATVEKYGKLANRCCFCNKGLTDPKSVEAGYGPTCASNYGLPWG
jgi:hypothetical protein